MMLDAHLITPLNLKTNVSVVNPLGITIGVHPPQWNCDSKHVRYNPVQ